MKPMVSLLFLTPLVVALISIGLAFAGVDGAWLIMAFYCYVWFYLFTRAMKEREEIPNWTGLLFFPFWLFLGVISLIGPVEGLGHIGIPLVLMLSLYLILGFAGIGILVTNWFSGVRGGVGGTRGRGGRREESVHVVMAPTGQPTLYTPKPKPRPPSKPRPAARPPGERIPSVPQVLQAIQDLPKGLPRSLWGMDWERIAEAVATGERTRTPKGRTVVRINERFYYADIEDRRTFLKEWRRRSGSIDPAR